MDQQGKPSSFLGQIADIPNQMKEAADNTDLGLRMSRHLQLTNGEGLPAVAIVDGSWQMGTYANTTPVVRIRRGSSARTAPSPTSSPATTWSQRCTCARMQPGSKLGVMVDPLNPTDFAIDWIRTGQLGPPPPGSVPGPGAPGARREI